MHSFQCPSEVLQLSHHYIEQILWVANCAHPDDFCWKHLIHGGRGKRLKNVSCHHNVVYSLTGGLQVGQQQTKTLPDTLFHSWVDPQGWQKKCCVFMTKAVFVGLNEQLPLRLVSIYSQASLSSALCCTRGFCNLSSLQGSEWWCFRKYQTSYEVNADRRREQTRKPPSSRKLVALSRSSTCLIISDYG